MSITCEIFNHYVFIYFLSQIDFAAQPVQQIKIFYKEKPNCEEQITFNRSYKTDVISYWKWHQYKITYVIYCILRFYIFIKLNPREYVFCIYL